MNSLNNLQKLLESGFDKPIAEELVSYYQSVTKNYFQGKWEASMSAGGKFVEVGLRALDWELFGKDTPFNEALSPFDDRLLKKYADHQTGQQSYKTLIPRVLRAAYDFRNTRGVAHASDISPNEMDATFVLYSVKWVLAEIVRLKSNLSPSEAKSLVEAITKRNIPLVWHEGEVIRILNPKISAKDKVLLLLSHFPDSKTDKELCKITEYSNISVFRKNCLKVLHREALIHYNAGNGLCTISPTGIARAEEVARKHAK